MQLTVIFPFISSNKKMSTTGFSNPSETLNSDNQSHPSIINCFRRQEHEAQALRGTSLLPCRLK